jgi:HEAT repeat protein
MRTVEKAMNNGNGEQDGAVIRERLRVKSLAGKRLVIEDLKKRAGRRSALLLVEMLKDESWYLREQAVQALGEVEEETEALRALLDLLRDGLWYSRAAAAKALGKIGDPQALEPLIRCLMDSNKTVQGAAAAALVDIVKRGSIEDLASKLDHSPADVKDRAMSCLKLIDAEIAADLADALERRVASGSPVRNIVKEEPEESEGAAEEDRRT